MQLSYLQVAKHNLKAMAILIKGMAMAFKNRWRRIDGMWAWCGK
ncbi:hypothetical protein HMPREF1991_01189 [Hoylesella loescheii DSM 19665 = JCM 12249 = ATCC 15930]|uniref:Uncharacterized protein n=1 Tax=Hoylesella loescheii DSM 19665 = JCM 12249 = ATCC 15930 TaxID=1122985 RepID=A0A069QJ93_HOYLO|nr:hypothetical protein HMPREF1991_01189 [Hoylesella loescheii DSM 19665 = JCM 12249 = ATCC 15930]